MLKSQHIQERTKEADTLGIWSSLPSSIVSFFIALSSVVGTVAYYWKYIQLAAEMEGFQVYLAIVVICLMAIVGLWVVLKLAWKAIFRSTTGHSEDTGSPRDVPLKKDNVCEFLHYAWEIRNLDPGENHGGPQKYFQLSLPIRFKRNVKDVTIKIRALRPIPPPIDRSLPEYSWKPVESKQYVAGDIERIIFATVAVNRQHHGYYGDMMRDDTFYIAGTSRHVFEITVFYERNSETTQIYLESPTRGVSANPPEGLGKLAGLVLLQEGDSVFEADWVKESRAYIETGVRPKGSDQGGFGFAESFGFH